MGRRGLRPSPYPKHMDVIVTHEAIIINLYTIGESTVILYTLKQNNPTMIGENKWKL